jgi:hypothetical protein
VATLRNPSPVASISDPASAKAQAGKPVNGSSAGLAAAEETRAARAPLT